MSNKIQTPYGPKTPEMLCRAMDALEMQPELLAALGAMTLWMSISGFGNTKRSKQWSMCEAARAAIAKARGEFL